MTLYPRGSEWRRWDLHIHTPFTRKNDGFTGSTHPSKSEEENTSEKWDGFFTSILNYVGDMNDPLKAIYAIGITDYFSIENYKRVIENTELINRIPLILPNVELRLLPAAKETPINIHCIFDSSLPVNTIENRFLSKLNYKYNNTPYSATNNSLIQLGKAIEPTIIDDFEAEKKALEQYVVNLSDLQELFNNDKELRGKTIIVISNKSTDGASGIGNPSTSGDISDLTALREELYKFSDAIFSGNPSDALYFIGKKKDISADSVKKKCGKLMPCLHGSDAHKNADLFEPDLKRYCWIKADPTFNGLRQIIFEPGERVRIAASKPEFKPPYQVIESVSFVDNELFQQEPIVFNQNLNCIIGGKSTGKSLLLHNIARSIDPEQTNDKIKYVNDADRTKSKINTLPAPEIVVRWLDSGDASGRKIIYIPQKYLNRLADDEESTTVIDDIIKKTILSRTDVDGQRLEIAEISMQKRIDAILSDGAKNLLILYEIMVLHMSMRIK